MKVRDEPMMSVDERKVALRNIESVVPSVVFDHLISILTKIGGCTNDLLVEALSRTSINPAYTFTYLMKTNERAETITLIREILDLCEGWFITSTCSMSSSGRVKWNVKSIIKKKLAE